jgi:hypothetical protein
MPCRTEFLEQEPLEVFADGMLEALGLVVNLEPFHAEELNQHALDQVMTPENTVGDGAARWREAEVTFRV